MGQTQGKERGEGGSGAGAGASGSLGGEGSSKYAKQTFDGGTLVPHGVYTGPQDYDHGVVRNLIFARKIAPFYPGRDDEDAYAHAPYNSECPICFLNYPSPLNHTRCCGQPICTECFVQIKRADPTHTNPPSSEPAACPYCQEGDFGVVYKAPPPGMLSGEVNREAGTAESASAAREQAEGIAEGSHAQDKRRKSFRAADPSVITTDTIRPDWQSKLHAAEAATTRRANRRIIMRQVGERLIPVGVSSSRMGADLPPGSTSGPGGAIIIGENTRWPGADIASATGVGGERRGSRSRRSELAQFLQNLGGGPDMEEVMMMEAMRLSLIEHEDQQRRQAQQEAEQRQREPAQQNETPTRSRTDASAATSARVSSSPPREVQRPLPRSSSLSGETPLAPARGTQTASELPPTLPMPPSEPLSAGQLGISSSMMAELSELIDDERHSNSLPSSAPEGADLPAAAAQILPSQTGAEPRPMPQATALGQGMQSAVPQPWTSAPSSPAPVSAATTPVGSPSRVGTNPNNPFRRMANNSTGPSGAGPYN